MIESVIIVYGVAYAYALRSTQRYIFFIDYDVTNVPTTAKLDCTLGLK